MNEAAPLFAAFVTWLSLAPLTEAATAAQRFPSDIDGVDLVVSCRPGPFATDYAAQTASSVPLTDPYAVKRGAEKGLVNLMSQGGRSTRRYGVSGKAIRASVTVKYDMAVLDRADLLFTARHLVFVHTSTTNAGIFTISDVYELPVGPKGAVDRTALKGDAELARLLDVGLSAYRPPARRCVF